MENTTKSVSSLGGSSIRPSGQDVARPSTRTGKPSFSKEDLERFTLTLLTTLVSEVSPDKYKLSVFHAKGLLADHGGISKEKSDEIEAFLIKEVFGPVRDKSLGGMLDRSGFW